VDPRAFCTSTRVLIVAGKGGVGKTTVSAALARMASLAGLRTLLVEIEGRSGLGAMFGRTGSLDYHEVALSRAGDPLGAAEIRARTLTPDDALVEYLDDHGMRRISKRLSRTGMIDVVATAVPGIKDILVLGKVKQLERAGRGDKVDTEEVGHLAELIVVDAPAAGHAVTFLESAHGLLDAVRVGPIRAQAQEVADLLRDPARTRVVLVTLPEETPVNELIDTAYALEDRVGIQLAPVVVNGVYPPLQGLDVDPVEAALTEGIELAPGEADALRAAAAFRRQRQELQSEQVSRLADALPLPQLRLPFLFVDRIGRPQLEQLAGALADEVRRLPELAGML
jgi:anion-transporting  ArsA/GET3 family ATPase